MKVSIVLLFLLLSFQTITAQNKTLVVGSAIPNPNAVLQVDAPGGNQGLLIPRLTTAQRTAMSLGASDKGLVVFDTDLSATHTWSGSSWTNSLTAQKIIYPYSDILNSATANSTLYNFGYNGTNSANLVRFQNFTATNSDTTFIVRSNGLGENAHFRVDNPLSTASALYAISNSKGVTLWGQNNSTTTGSAGYFLIGNSANSSSALTGSTNGSGAAVFGSQTGTGRAGQFQITNAGNTNPALRGVTNGLGNAGFFTINNLANDSSALYIQTNGSGNAVTTNAPIQAKTNQGADAAISGISNGLLEGAGFFQINNAANNNTALYVGHNGTGSAIVGAKWSTDGHAAQLINQNPTNAGNALYAVSNSTAASTIHIEQNNSASGNAALFAITAGTGASIQGETDSGFAAVFGRQTGTTSINNAVFGQNAGNGYAGLFENTLSTNIYAALEARNIGTGPALLLNHTGSTGNIAIFQSAGLNTARIDKSGVGYFNGGTFNGGADVAEMFEIEGNRQSYEPGDVLVISESTDRTVEKSSSPNSTKVVGVYATKPGVILTEKSIEEQLDDLIPMGVMGVIPTKVCNENGSIKRGDLLTTSSLRGHAMKAKPLLIDGMEMYATGTIIGKALENFDTNTNTGLIKVLVNVK